MEFNKGKSIFLQIADLIIAHILKKTWAAEDKIPSVRELAVELQVNPNTVMRTYSYLQEKDIIYNKRGLGFFIGEKAISQAQTLKKKEFTEVELPEIFKAMDVLNISMAELEKIYSGHTKPNHPKK